MLYTSDNLIALTMSRCRVLARNEEFSEIAVINIYFYSSQQKKTVICGGEGPAGKISR